MSEANSDVYVEFLNAIKRVTEFFSSIKSLYNEELVLGSYVDNIVRLLSPLEFVQFVSLDDAEAISRFLYLVNKYSPSAMKVEYDTQNLKYKVVIHPGCNTHINFININDLEKKSTL
jgi:hypothetical protein